MFLGGLERCAGYRRFSGASAIVTASSPEPIHRDGDPEAPVDRVEVRLRPRALEVVVPAATLTDPTGPLSARP
jgi:diacylglycerol kinase family enzyme